MPGERERVYCPICKRRGAVRVEPREGLWSVLRKIEAWHAQRTCQGGVLDVRLLGRRG